MDITNVTIVYPDNIKLTNSVTNEDIVNFLQQMQLEEIKSSKDELKDELKTMNAKIEDMKAETEKLKNENEKIKNVVKKTNEKNK